MECDPWREDCEIIHKRIYSSLRRSYVNVSIFTFLDPNLSTYDIRKSPFMPSNPSLPSML